MTVLAPLVGGALIGLSVSLLLLSHGRTAGISGLWGGLLRADIADRPFRLWFFGGLVAAGAALHLIMPSAFAAAAGHGPLLTVGAGLLVGYGTRLGGGCTSGHGVCGISRFEVRSIAATVTFMAFGALAVLAARLLEATT